MKLTALGKVLYDADGLLHVSEGRRFLAKDTAGQIPTPHTADRPVAEHIVQGGEE